MHKYLMMKAEAVTPNKERTRKNDVQPNTFAT